MLTPAHQRPSPHSPQTAPLEFLSTGGAGAGYVQIDIIISKTDGVMYDKRVYSGTGVVHQPQADMVLTDAVHPGSCEYWIHPRLLAQLKSSGDGSYRVLRGPWVVGKTTYQAVIFQSIGGPSRTSIVYDQASGIKLGSGDVSYSTSNHTGYDANTGRTTPGTSENRTISNSVFAGLRNLELPWGNEPLDATAMNIKACTFNGSMGIQNPMAGPGTPIMDTCKVVYRGADCYQVRIDRSVSGVKLTLHRGTSANQIGGLSMNVSALNKLRQGQTVDQDPITRIRTYVQFVGSNQAGVPIVVITEEGSGGYFNWCYSSQTGKLLAHATAQIQSGIDPYVTYLECVGN